MKIKIFFSSGVMYHNYVLFKERSDDADTTPLVVKITQQDTNLPDFGGHSPIGKHNEDEVRPHGKI